MENQPAPGENEPSQNRIVEAKPKPAWPDNFEDDYGYAVLHIATLRLRETERCLLLFGLMELYPKEIPQLIENTKPTTRKLSGSKSKAERYVHTQRIVMPIREALQWYTYCLKQPTSIAIPYADITVDVFHLSPEPTWPSMICIDDHSFIPFLAAWQRYARLHQMISLSFSMDILVDRKVLSAKQAEEIGTILNDHLHFDIGQFPDLYGSISLLAPNPIFRDLTLKLKEATGPAEDTIIYEVTPRHGRTMDGTIMVIEEERPCGHRTHMVSMTGLSGEISLPYHIEQNRTKVIHNQYGLIFSRGPAQFIRQVSIQQEYCVGKRVINDVNGKREIPLIRSMPERNMTVDAEIALTGDDQSLFTPTSLNATSRLYREKSRQRARMAASALNQEAFQKDVKGAERAVERRIEHARESIWFVDSYFTETELKYTTRIRNTSVLIKILTSAKVLRMNPTDTKDGTPGDPKMRHGIKLLEGLQALQKQKYQNPIEIRVLEGKESPVHDRFIFVDGMAHLLGNSLNNLGDNYSVVLTSPDSMQIIRDIESFWSKAVELKAWVDRSSKID